jgi:phenylacetate-CoA ligase
MNESLLALYRHLPAPMRHVAASLRGISLKRWRYGPETDRLVEEALERESWDASRWRAWQQQQLAPLLHRAATTVPYYQAQWAQRRRHGDTSSVEQLENWPILEKGSLRAAARSFVAEDRDLRSMVHEHTSGTTGTPIHLWSSRETARKWYALFEARVRRWNGITRHDRWAILGGQLVTPAARTRPPFWVWNAGLNQLYMSAYHIAPSTAGDYLDAMRRYGVTYVLGYASSLHSLANFARSARLAAPRLRVAISNAEPLTELQRLSISEAFGCPVRDTYGMAEIACAAGECSAGSLHLWPDAGITEVVDAAGAHPVAAEQTGRLVCTGLINSDMPLIRYDVGDLGSLADTSAACACGRRLPLLREISGRADDVIQTPDGRRVGRLDPVFKSDLAILEAQVIQESRRDVVVKVVPSSGFGAGDVETIQRRLEERLGHRMRISVEAVEAIPRTAAGKFRAVVSRLDEDGSDVPTRAAG